MNYADYILNQMDNILTNDATKANNSVIGKIKMGQTFYYLRTTGEHWVMYKILITSFPNVNGFNATIKYTYLSGTEKNETASFYLYIPSIPLVQTREAIHLGGGIMLCRDKQSVFKFIKHHYRRGLLKTPNSRFCENFRTLHQEIILSNYRDKLEMLKNIK